MNAPIWETYAPDIRAKALLLGVLAAALAAGCGGARPRPRDEPVSPPAPTGPAATDDLQHRLAEQLDGSNPDWAGPNVDAAHAVRVADAPTGESLYFVPAPHDWCVGVAAGDGLAATSCAPRTGGQPALEAGWGGDPTGTHGVTFLVYGWAAPPAVRAELELADGTTRPLELHQGFFVLSLDAVASRPATVAAFDDHGNRLLDRPLVSEQTWKAFQSFPTIPTTPPTRSVSVPFGDGDAKVQVAADGTCAGFSSGSSGNESEIGFVLWGLDDDTAATSFSLFGLPDTTVVMGTVDGDATGATLRLSDGGELPATVSSRCVVSAVDPADDTAARHPASVRWQDASGGSHELPVDVIWPTFQSDDQ